MKQRVPDHLVHECDTCGRRYVTGSTRDRYDCTGLTAGYGGMCWRDRARLHNRGTLELEQQPSLDTAEEVQHLMDLGLSRDAAIRRHAEQRGIQVESVRTALRRAARRTERQDVAA